jgi:hypothetical protein
MRERQSGVSLIFVVIAIVGVAVVFLAMATLFRSTSGTVSSAKTATSFAAAAAALEQFAGTSGRLPCPADPTASTGDAAPNAPAATCTFPMGTIPWRTVGMRSVDALDAWGWKISYRVFSGPTGLTQEGGASMVDCDTVPIAPTLPTAPGGLCGLLHNHTEAQFLRDKGLHVNDFGTNRTDIAYVLISHGPSGLGAHTSAGIPKSLPTSAAELANINTTNATDQFIAKAAVTQGIAPDAPTYFDDILAFQTVSEFVKRSNLSARDWTEVADNSIAAFTMDASTVGAAIGGSTPTADTSTGRKAIDFGTGDNQAHVRAFDSGGAVEISFNTVGGAPGLGVVGNGTNLMTSTNNERLRIDFDESGWKLGIALGGFGTYDVSGTTYTEQVQFRFSGGASNVVIMKAGCRADGGVATFSIDPGTDFTHLEIRPQPATSLAGPGVTATTLADFKTCTAGAAECFSNLATASNRCP